MNLSVEIESEIRKRVESGEYRSADEVVRHALELLGAVEAEEAGIRKAVAEGIAELDRGEGIDGVDVFAELRARHAQAARESA